MGRIKRALASGRICAGCGRMLRQTTGHAQYCSDCAQYANMIGGGGPTVV